MSKFAANTTVSPGKSKAEIESVLQKYGATGFYSGWQESPPASAIGFQIAGRMMRIDMPMPDPNGFKLDGRGSYRTQDQQKKAYDQAVRQRWRALLLIVKAKLEYVDCGMSTVEREFMADIILPSGEKLDAFIGEQLAEAYETGKMPSLLPAFGGTE